MTEPNSGVHAFLKDAAPDFNPTLKSSIEGIYVYKTRPQVVLEARIKS